MSIDPVTLGLARTALATDPAPTTAPTDGATSQAAPQTAGKDMFLKLLVAQLKYQNPMEPVDSSQFMAQTAQFTMVEKLEAMAAQTDALVAGEASQRAAGLLGRQVGYLDDQGADQSGVVTGTKLGADGPVLLLGKTEVPLSGVREVTLAPAAPTPAPAPATA
ncbi:MAG TPA: flagellar hook capping FlgD N-terminal domain-containing protein [Acidimicrobiia bacterium]|nr:flagellar hook capping FlgD N-terminal domain-containing protein [Acidimicrobiia bacterium]